MPPNKKAHFLSFSLHLQNFSLPLPCMAETHRLQIPTNKNKIK